MPTLRPTTTSAARQCRAYTFDGSSLGPGRSSDFALPSKEPRRLWPAQVLLCSLSLDGPCRTSSICRALFPSIQPVVGSCCCACGVRPVLVRTKWAAFARLTRVLRPAPWNPEERLKFAFIDYVIREGRADAPLSDTTPRTVSAAATICQFVARRVVWALSRWLVGWRTFADQILWLAACCVCSLRKLLSANNPSGGRFQQPRRRRSNTLPHQSIHHTPRTRPC